jgi:L-rhamnose-H+ transport protein
MYPGALVVQHSLFSGVAIILVAGLLSGVFVLPTRGVREWDWEHIWLVYSISAFLLLPPGLAAILSPRVFFDVLGPQIYLAARVAIYGLLFGIGCVLFGITWSRLGIAVTNALVSGVNVLVGSVGPVIVGAVSLDTRGWHRLLLGILPLLIGLALSTMATISRDRCSRSESKRNASVVQSLPGIVIAFASGALSAMLNIGFSVGSPLEDQASSFGYSPPLSTMAIWIPVLIGGFVANFAYPALLIQRRRTWGTLVKLQNSLSLWIRSLFMGVLWSAAIFIYGYGARVMGEGGTTYGWAIVTGGGILGSLLLGELTGEWKNSGMKSKVLMGLSVAAMLLSFTILSIQ